jgi:hypothetical protein
MKRKLGKHKTAALYGQWQTLVMRGLLDESDHMYHETALECCAFAVILSCFASSQSPAATHLRGILVF